MSKIAVMIRRPGETWERREVDNTLESFQELVRGFEGGPCPTNEDEQSASVASARRGEGWAKIETVSVSRDLALIVNEEGKLQGLPANVLFRGDWLVGTVVAVGVDGEEFVPCPLETDWQMRVALGVENARRS